MHEINLAARLSALCVALAATAAAAAQQSAPQSAPPQSQNPPAAQATAAQPAVEEWRDDFDGDHLDETKWELHTLEGGGGKIQVKDGQLKMRGAGNSRSGVRSRRMFHGERFYVEATPAKVGGQLPQPGQDAYQPGFAILTVLFGGSSVNRLEWILRSDGLFEAWSFVDGRGERFDNRSLGTKEKNPHLGVGRRGDQFFFMLNGQVGLERTVRGMPADFKVMLYGFGSTENNWDSVSVQTPKQ